MPASRRHHRALAVFVNCLGILAAVPALPSTGPATRATAATPAASPATAARPAAPEASPAAGARAAPAAPRVAASGAVVPVTPTAPAPGMTTAGNPGVPRPAPQVTVAVAPAATSVPGYRIIVRNTGSATVRTMVRQGVPADASITAVSAGGLTTRPGGATGGGEVTWRLVVPAGATRTLDTALAATAPGQDLTAPACAYASDGDQPYDCATATWHSAGTPEAAVPATPAWRQPPILLGLALVLLALLAGGLWWWLRARRRVSGVAPAATGHPPYTGGPTTPGGGTVYPSAGATAAPGGGTVYPRPAAPGPVGRRRSPSVWLVVGVAATVLAGVVLAATWTATRQVAAIDTTKQPTAGAWTGTSITGAVGTPLREKAFEFTVYRVACGTAKAARQQCQATVGVRNVTPEQQSWHGQLQRAYLPGGTWVSTDEDATRLANLGRDVFAQPVSAGSRVVLPLVFTVHGMQKPKQLELRSGVFSAGVRVDVP
ncbi:hypothetical protein GA0070216_106121 [Micromonospora matsumotoense]|uniref:DUF4352 domain-containing protein n=1 Tax=Micromonospora matsumotoense TaxID=121616 RepID=A0A1C4YDT1_9ACTN|nr:hypothetical protein [Micromonospora matsumotoense]SCF18858.1 hypothetical protein GA0070216_106121 [Micromonospora matsumotoense]